MSCERLDLTLLFITKGLMPCQCVLGCNAVIGHKYKIGQLVRYRRRERAPGIYLVT